MRSPTLVLLGLCFAVLNNGVAAAGDEAATRAEFNGAYKAYQELAEQDRLTDALPFAERAYQLGKELYGPADRSTGALAVNYGKSLARTGRFQEAREILETAVDIYEKVYGIDARELVDPLMELGHASAEPGDSQPQRRVYARALDIAKKKGGEGSVHYGRLLMEAGSNILMQSGTDDGLPYLKRSLEVFEKAPDANRGWIARVQFNLGKHYLAAGKLASAEEHFLDALDSAKVPAGPDSRLELATHAFLVEVYQRQRQPERGTNHCLAIGSMTPFTSTQDYMPLFRRNPDYPDMDLRRGRQGAAEIGFTVDASGMVQDPRVVASSGSTSLDDAAIEAVKDWRYAPRFEDGEPVFTADVRTVIKFQIEP